MALTSDHEFAPSDIASAVFPTAFRGFDQDAVRQYLVRLSTALEREQRDGELGPLQADAADGRVVELEGTVETLRSEIQELELELVQRSVVGKAGGSAASGGGTTDFDEHRAIELLGQETARVLESARSAAADILRRAEAQAAAAQDQAKAELNEAHAQSETLVAQRQLECDQLLRDAEAGAEAAARRITADAEKQHRLAVEESTKIVADAEATAAESERRAEERARQIVADAEALRQKVIADLVTEKHAAGAELAALGACRDRLATSLAIARSELDDLADDLASVEVPSRRDRVRTEAERDPVEFVSRPTSSEIAKVIAELDSADGELGESSERSSAFPVGGDRHDSVDRGDVDRGDSVADAERRTGEDSVEDSTDATRGTQDEIGVGVGDAAEVGLPSHGSVERDDGVEVGIIADLIESASAVGETPDADTPASVVDAADQASAENDVIGADTPFVTVDLGDIDLTDGIDIDLTEETNGSGPDAARHASGDRVGAAQTQTAVTAPEEVITTVASRIAPAVLGRTRGDLPVEDAYTGRLAKEFSARDLALTRCGANFRRQLRRALNDDQSDMLDRLRAGRGPISTDELPEYAEQIDRYLVPLRRGLSEVARAGANAGKHHELSPAALDNLVRQLAKFIVDRLRNPAEDALRRDSTGDRERILEPIRALYREFRNTSLADLAEDALYEAFAIGLYDSIADNVDVRWINDPRRDPDPICEINAERGDGEKGEVYPSGHVRPLALPGCRCLVVPV